MHGMTERACPVCATPHEAGATTCAFCGFSLGEPDQAAKAETQAEPPAEVAATREPAAGTGTPVEAGEADGTEATPEDATEPASVAAGDIIAEESSSRAPIEAEQTVASPADRPEPLEAPARRPDLVRRP